MLPLYRWEMSHVMQTGLELVFRKGELSTDFQTPPPADAPICFRQAVIGLSSQSAGFRVKWITFDHGCGLAETAYLLRDVHVLICPHGNAIGTSVFMPITNPVPTLISLDTSRYSECWFINTASAISQYFMQSVCGPHRYVNVATKSRCPYYKDTDLAHRALGIWGTSIVLGDLTDDALEEFRKYVKRTPSAQRLVKVMLDILICSEYPVALLKKYDDEITMYFLEGFWRDSPRYVDAPRIVALVQELQKDQEREQVTAASVAVRGERKPELNFQQYLNYLRESRACGVKYCRQILTRNVMSSSRAYGIHSLLNGICLQLTTLCLKVWKICQIGTQIHSSTRDAAPLPRHS
ncbi:hypothetical protein BGZ95_006334 [Linnemannia exigua]|uniref:Uncharacterized protein n=1 Tax=Linnemannia exigua TaxID=604196 RepID=A0AAD4H8B1_9FUNG|nr:hypothetical protein BGZ95_006334 [Linnemannia exigua]